MSVLFVNQKAQSLGVGSMCLNPLFRLNPKRVPSRIFLTRLLSKYNRVENRDERWNVYKHRYISDTFFLTKLGIEYAQELGLGEYILELPCRKCLECLNEWTNQWTARCQLESRYHDSSLFITLTYRDNDVPILNGFESLRYRDFQLFMKRLRKAYGKPLRYRVCSEYGTDTRRPHYHAIIFGLNLHDLRFLYSVVHGKKVYSASRGGQQHYTSAWLENLWQKGFVDIAAVDYGSIRYVSDYMNKFELQGYDCYDLITQWQEHCEDLDAQKTCYIANVNLGVIAPPKTNQSSRPAIGKCAYEDLKEQMKDTDSLPTGLHLRVKHVKYLDSLLFSEFPWYKEGILKHRASLAKAVVYDDPHSPEERREIRRRNLEAMFRCKSRSF